MHDKRLPTPDRRTSSRKQNPIKPHWINKWNGATICPYPSITSIKKGGYAVKWYEYKWLSGGDIVRCVFSTRSCACARERVLGVIFKWIYDGKVYARLRRFLFDFRISKLFFSLRSLSRSTPFLVFSTNIEFLFRLKNLHNEPFIQHFGSVQFNSHCIGTCVRLSHFSSSYKQKAHPHTHTEGER